MIRCWQSYLFLGATFLGWLAVVRPAAATSAGAPPLGRGEIVITEFFEELFRIDPHTGLKTHLDPGFFNPDDHIVIDRTRQIIAIDGTDHLVRFKPTDLSITPLTLTPFTSIRDIAVEPGGTILLADFDHIYRVNPWNGVTTTLFDDAGVNGGFFSIRDLTVTPTGRIFVTEFFEDFWEIDALSGLPTPLATSQDVALPRHINARSDGDLIVQDFVTKDLLRVDPDSGAVTTFASGLPTFVRDIAVEHDNDVLVAWSNGVDRYDADTGVGATITFETPFFSPERIAVVPVPEPATLTLAICVAACCSRRRVSWRG